MAIIRLKNFIGKAFQNNKIAKKYKNNQNIQFSMFLTIF
jgi:hypothetical protein